MTKIIGMICCLLLLSLCACNNVTPKETASSQNSQIVNGKFGKQLEKRPVRMFNLDGELYFDSGLISDTEARCGTLDKILKKSCDIGEVPKQSGQANFDCDGCQMVTKITCEVPVDGQWLIFKKYENLAGESKNLTGFPYCYYIKGRLHNAAIDSELVVLTGDLNVTFSEIFEPLLSSQFLSDAPKQSLSYHLINSGDKWGISCSPENLTNHSMTFEIEQFGGAFQGELQTGEWFALSHMVEDEWVPCETNPLIDYAFPMVAYSIRKNDITEFEIEWEWLYGELSPGYYRLDKKVMDFRGSGDFEEQIYSVHFTIE